MTTGTKNTCTTCKHWKNRALGEVANVEFAIDDISKFPLCRVGRKTDFCSRWHWRTFVCLACDKGDRDKWKEASVRNKGMFYEEVRNAIEWFAMRICVNKLPDGDQFFSATTDEGNRWEDWVVGFYKGEITRIDRLNKKEEKA